MWYVEGRGGIWLLKNVCAILAHTLNSDHTIVSFLNTRDYYGDNNADTHCNGQNTKEFLYLLHYLPSSFLVLNAKVIDV